MKQRLSRFVVLALTLVAAFGLSGRCAWAAPDPPPEYQFGDTRLLLNGVGTRILYYMRVYSCALYLPQVSRSLDYIMDEQTPVAIRVQVLFENPPDTLPSHWRQSIRSELSEKMFYRMREAYEDVSSGDVIVFAYAPAHGTMVLINERLVVIDAGHGLMKALLNQWVGTRAVSDELRLALVGQ